MTPEYYEEYLMHLMTQAEAKRVVDEFFVRAENGLIHPVVYQDLHLYNVGELGDFTTMMQDRIGKAMSVPPERLGVGDRLFDKMAKATVVAEKKPSIKLTDIRDFANG